MAAIEQVLGNVLKELQAEKARMELAIAQLHAMMSPTADASMKATRAPRPVAKAIVAKSNPVKVGRREKTSALSFKVLTYIKSNPGERMEHISTGIKMPSSKLKYVVKSLVADKQLSVRGNTRGRTYTVA